MESSVIGPLLGFYVRCRTYCQEIGNVDSVMWGIERNKIDVKLGYTAASVSRTFKSNCAIYA